MKKLDPEVRKENQRLAQKRWYLANKDKSNAQAKAWSKENAGKYYLANRERILARGKKYAREQRLVCIEYYSLGKNCCQCCGEEAIEFLALDHIEGGGREHKKTEGFATLASWLIKKEFPEGFRVLCHNCNCARGFYGKCPHEGETNFYL